MNGNGVAASSNGNGGAVGTFRVKAGLAQMLKGGVIMGKLNIGATPCISTYMLLLGC